ncbi:MAG: hypothetical protein A2428_17915 [Bdellovibrionales bacterium RIFOXYC1_FULL_54_43]|nr:MAG: hypothetical protein A2428_17915 [Bdellovibrionales bacterium RIFOXYC1_FULL_54_43]OFZ79698.1 MAG: hypothetical protein A2603_06105 [Bdellovibrionales bacterium RIFOXYD1_FULL_55_31]
MPRYRKIYESEAATYDALVSREDWQGNLAPALDRICPLAEKVVVEFGAGTGRLTRLLARKAKIVHAFDSYPAMLAQAQVNLSRERIGNAHICIGDNRSIPMPEASADIAIAGWTFGHFTSWHPETWTQEIGAALGEMARVTRPAGTQIIIETLGTGSAVPVEPTDRLSQYYALLERKYGFLRTWIRTDYRFRSRQEADSLTSAFFGKEYSTQVDSDGAVILPECTGIWVRNSTEK